VQPSYFDIRTEVAIGPRSQFQHTSAKTNPCNQFTGCVGKVTYQVKGKVDALTLKQLNTLADFALYAGVGCKTPVGMGVTHRISSTPALADLFALLQRGTELLWLQLP